MSERSERSEPTRWHNGGGGWRPGAEGRPDEVGYRVPEPRGNEAAEPLFAAGAGSEPRYAGQEQYGGRYAEAGPGPAVPEGTFPGFAPSRGPVEPGYSGAGLAATPYPEIPADLSSPPFGSDPTATAEHAAVLDAPAPPIGPPPIQPPPRPPGATPPAEPGSADQTTRLRAEPLDRADPVDRSSLLDRGGLRGPGGPPAPVGSGVYRTRRSGVALLFALLAAVLEVPALLLLFDGVTAESVSAAAVVSGTFLTLGLPAAAIGLYALVTGAGRAPDEPMGRAWLRPPLVYLAVGLVLFLSAALAAA